MTNPTSVPPVAPSNATSPAQPNRRRWWLWGCGGFLAFILLIVATVALTIWWIQRPIKPVVLSSAEKKVVETKLEQARNAPVPRDQGFVVVTNSSASPSRYTPGGKELRLTEREINGLLNDKTDLGDRVRIELDTDAINAYIAVPIPKDFPIGGGRTFRARGRFRLSLSQDQAPVAMLEDVSVFGLSLPKEWLGGLKGKNLLADVVGDRNGTITWKGIKSLRVVSGAIVLEVGD